MQQNSPNYFLKRCLVNSPCVRQECTEKLWHCGCYTGMDSGSSTGISPPARKHTVTLGIKCIWKRAFQEAGLGEDTSSWSPPCDATVCFSSSSSSLSLGQEQPLAKPSRTGNGRGGGGVVVLGKQGQEKPQLSTAMPWPSATSVTLMVHIWFHMGETQAALAEQTARPRDFAPDPRGHPTGSEAFVHH